RSFSKYDQGLFLRFWSLFKPLKSDAPFLALRQFTSGERTSAYRRTPCSPSSANFPGLAHRASSRRPTTWARLRWICPKGPEGGVAWEELRYRRRANRLIHQAKGPLHRLVQLPGQPDRRSQWVARDRHSQ